MIRPHEVLRRVMVRRAFTAEFERVEDASGDMAIAVQRFRDGRAHRRGAAGLTVHGSRAMSDARRGRTRLAYRRRLR